MTPEASASWACVSRAFARATMRFARMFSLAGAGAGFGLTRVVVTIGAPALPTMRNVSATSTQRVAPLIPALR